MLILSSLQRVRTSIGGSLPYKLDSIRCISSSLIRHSENSEEVKKEDKDTSVDPKNRRKRIPVETSIKYMTSDAYKQTYGDNPVWKLYRRNFKGGIPPRKTRRTCIRAGYISTGNPCPICRDEYLVFDHRNVKLLEQFISKYNGDVLSYSQTGICQHTHKRLLVALTRAKDYGTITFDVPIRQYDYSQWNGKDEQVIFD